MRRNELLHRLPTAPFTIEIASVELERARAVLIGAAEKVADAVQAGKLPPHELLRECAAAGTWVMRWEDALERLHELKRRLHGPP